MWKADQWKDYEVLDTSDGEKLERWGSFYLVRPDPQVIWSTPRQDPRWKRFDARYARSSTGGGHWSAHHLPEHWCIRYRELTFQVKPMNFKHTGVFPEQAANWDFIDDQIRRAGRPVSVLNLFAYTGGATLAAAAAGASVCHVDAAKGVRLVGSEMCIRDRIWKLEKDLFPFLKLVSGVLSDDPLFFIINSYTTGLAPSVLTCLLDSVVTPRFGGGTVSDELGLPVTDSGLVLPCGATGRWTREGRA